MMPQGIMDTQIPFPLAKEITMVFKAKDKLRATSESHFEGLFLRTTSCLRIMLVKQTHTKYFTRENLI